MTELEKMQRALMYMENLANGIDPITGTELPEDTVLNNVRLSRCFFYVSDILKKVIANNGEVGKRAGGRKKPFALSPGMREQVYLPVMSVPISDFVKNINMVIQDSDMRSITTKMVTTWLVDKGLLQEITAPLGKKTKIVTEQSSLIGIWKKAGRDKTAPIPWYCIIERLRIS